MYGYIYKIKTTASTKVYIGQTTKSIAERYKMHLAAMNMESKKTLHLYLAMHKYGVETFSIEQIDTANSQEELDKKEQYWIDFYDSINNGYNMMAGGSGINPMSSTIVKEKHDTKMRSLEVRTKISSTLSNLRTTIGFSDEHKQKIKESRAKRKELRAKQGLNFYEHPEHMASRSIKVYCILNTGERFDFESILEAGRWWYDTYHPFGDIYSTATYQRKILASISGKEIVFGNKNHNNYKIITNITWYKNESEVVPIYE